MEVGGWEEGGGGWVMRWRSDGEWEDGVER